MTKYNAKQPDIEAKLHKEIHNEYKEKQNDLGLIFQHEPQTDSENIKNI